MSIVKNLNIHILPLEGSVRMSGIVWLAIILSAVCMMVMLYALLHVAHDADERAGYMEEYGMDFDEDDFYE